MLNLIHRKLSLPLSDLILGTSFANRLDFYEQLMKKSEKDIQEYQNIAMFNILNHAINNIEYYKKCNIDKVDINCFPIINKLVVRENLDSFIWDKRDKGKLIKMQTSGSSGIHAISYHTKYEQSSMRALQALWWIWAGYDFGDKMLQTGMDANRSFVKSLKDRILNIDYLIAFSLSEEMITNRLKRLINNKNVVIGGYASSINYIAEVAIKNDIKIDVKTVISWGDKLYSHFKKNIKKAFNVAPFDTYGMSEGFLVGAQKDLDYMYIMSPHVYIEVLDEKGNKVPDGELGYIHVTRLDNYTMPFIRYKTGDIGSLLERKNYPVKRELNLPLLKCLIGRETDVIRFSSGEQMNVHSFTGIIEYYEYIIQFKVIQKSVDHIHILYIKRDGFNTSDLDKLKSEINDKLQINLYITFEEVNFIENSKSGKPQILESEI